MHYFPQKGLCAEHVECCAYTHKTKSCCALVETKNHKYIQLCLTINKSPVPRFWLISHSCLQQLKQRRQLTTKQEAINAASSHCLMDLSELNKGLIFRMMYSVHKGHNMFSFYCWQNYKLKQNTYKKFFKDEKNYKMTFVDNKFSLWSPFGLWILFLQNDNLYLLFYLILNCFPSLSYFSMFTSSHKNRRGGGVVKS